MFPLYTKSKSLELTSPPWETPVLFLKRILITLLFTGITGVCSKVRFYLPFTPVPVTGQVFAVLLSGAVLGKEYGALSQVFYITLGLSGVPWFAVFPLIPTGGYLVGFIGAPYIIGLILERSKKINLKITLLSMISGVLIIYLFGLLLFLIFTQRGLLESVRLAILPFIPFDLGKALIAAFASNIIIKKMRKRPN